MNRPEQQIQRALLEHIKLRGRPGLVYWHTPNQNPSKAQRSINASLGVRAGVGDLLFLHDGKFFSLELKTTSGQSSYPQECWQKDVNTAKGFATVAHGIDAALATLELWGLLKSAKSGTNGLIKKVNREV